MSASSVHDVPIFFAFHSKIALRKVFGEILRWAFWTRISLHSSRYGRRPTSLHEMYLEYFLRYYWHSNFRRQHWPHDHSRHHPVNNYLEVPSQTWCLLIQRKHMWKMLQIGSIGWLCRLYGTYTKNSKTFTTTAQLVGCQRRCHNDNDAYSNLSITFCHARWKRTFCHVVKLSNQYHAIFVTHV